MARNGRESRIDGKRGEERRKDKKEPEKERGGGGGTEHETSVLPFSVSLPEGRGRGERRE